MGLTEAKIHLPTLDNMDWGQLRVGTLHFGSRGGESSSLVLPYRIEWNFIITTNSLLLPSDLNLPRNSPSLHLSCFLEVRINDIIYVKWLPHWLAQNKDSTYFITVRKEGIPRWMETVCWIKVWRLTIRREPWGMKVRVGLISVGGGTPLVKNKWKRTSNARMRIWNLIYLGQ